MLRSRLLWSLNLQQPAARPLLVHRAGYVARHARPASTLPSVAQSSDDHKALYCLGANFGRQLGNLKCLDSDELDAVLAGMRDCIREDPPQCDLQAFMPRAATVLKDKQQKAAGDSAADGVAALAAAAAEDGAVQTGSGLVILTLRAGDGPMPALDDKVRVHYEGRLIDGTIFDSSYQRGQPAEFPLKGVIKGWTEGLQLLQTGAKAKLTIPPDLGYGQSGTGPIPPQATLIFDVELLEILDNSTKDGSLAAMAEKAIDADKKTE